MKYYYRTSSKGRAGCSNISATLWCEEAKSKAEVIRRHKTSGNKVEVFTEEQAKELLARAPYIRVYER